MLQQYAVNTGGNAQLAVLDLMPDGSTPLKDGRRWQSGDPAPVRIMMDFITGAEACERNPLRYRPELMPDAEYAALVKSFEEGRP